MDSEDRLEEFTNGATHYYPITEGERERLQVQLQRYDEGPTDRWLNFTTMDNRYVFVNPVALESIQMLSDHVVEMPDYEQEETYRAISAILNGAEGTDIEKSEEESSPYSRQLIEKCRALIEDWGGVEAAAKRMSYLHAERMDGEQLSLPVDDKVMSRLGLDLAEGATKVQFIDLYPEGYYRATFFRLGALRLVEAPLHRYHDALEIDDDEVEETKPTLVSVKRVTAGGGGKA
jgi:hypothetical protein